MVNTTSFWIRSKWLLEGCTPLYIGMILNVKLWRYNNYVTFQDYQQAVESLLPLEKNCRVNHDAVSLSRVLVAIVEICFNKKAWKDLNENIAALTKVNP